MDVERLSEQEIGQIFESSSRAIEALGFKGSVDPNNLVRWTTKLIELNKFKFQNPLDPRGWSIERLIGFNSPGKLNLQEGIPLMVVGNFKLDGWSGNEAYATVQLGKVESFVSKTKEWPSGVFVEVVDIVGYRVIATKYKRSERRFVIDQIQVPVQPKRHLVTDYSKYIALIPQEQA